MADAKFTGATFHKASGRWLSRIEFLKSITLGYFESERDAALAYDFAAAYMGRKKVNFPLEETPESIVRKVRPKLTQLRAEQKLAVEVDNTHDEYWLLGYTPGVQWAQGAQRDPVDLDSLKCDWGDPESIIGALGVSQIYDYYVSGFKNSGRTLLARKMTWIKGFIRGAKDVWLNSKRESNPKKSDFSADVEAMYADIRMKSAARENPQPTVVETANPVLKEWETPEYKAKILEVAAKQAIREANPQDVNPDLICEDFTTDGEFIFGMPHENGAIFSPECNPRTLAAVNAAIRQSVVDRTGLYAEIDAWKAKQVDADAILEGII